MKTQEEKDRKDIERRLKLSNAKLWNSLSNEEREHVITKYDNYFSIENIGLQRVLEDNRDLRRNMIFMLLGVLMGIFGSIIATILLKYIEGTDLHNVLKDAVVLMFSLIAVFYFGNRLADRASGWHLKSYNVLEYLLKEIRK